MAVLHHGIFLILFFAQLAVKTTSSNCIISSLFQQFNADLCAYNHISLDCNASESLTASVTLSCAANHSSVISVTQVLQYNNSTIGATCHDYIRNPLMYRLCNRLCSITFCSAICDKLKIGFYSVCSYCSNRTTHCVIPLSHRNHSSSAQNSSIGTTTLPTESGSSVFLTRGSTAIIVLLGLLCLVCVLGSLARQKKRGRCFEPSESFGSCPSEPATAESTQQLDPITIPTTSSCSRECHFSHVQIPIIREHSFTNPDHDKGTATTGGKSKQSSLIEPAPPAYETLESDCSIQSVIEESEEPPPTYSSVVVEAEVAERSISLPDLTVV